MDVRLDGVLPVETDQPDGLEDRLLTAKRGLSVRRFYTLHGLVARNTPSLASQELGPGNCKYARQQQIRRLLEIIDLECRDLLRIRMVSCITAHSQVPVAAGLASYSRYGRMRLLSCYVSVVI